MSHSKLQPALQIEHTAWHRMCASCGWCAPYKAIALQVRQYNISMGASSFLFRLSCRPASLHVYQTALPHLTFLYLLP